MIRRLWYYAVFVYGAVKGLVHYVRNYSEVRAFYDDVRACPECSYDPPRDTELCDDHAYDMEDRFMGVE